MPPVRLLLICVVVLTLASACQSGHDSDDREECDRLVDHLVTLQLSDSSSQAPERQREVEKHRTILRRAIRDHVVADCLKHPAAHTDCALRARTSAELEECD
jgi:hypothetical protein